MLTYEPSLDFGVFQVDTYGERIYGFGTGLTQHSPMIQLWAMLNALQKHEAELVTDFRRACDALDLDYADGVAVAIRLDPTQHVRLYQQQEHPRLILPALSCECIFVIARDALAGDRTERIWRRGGFTYSRLRDAITSETGELQAGADPRDPW